QRWTQFQATFSFAPPNQVVHSGPRERSTTCCQGSKSSSPRSSTTAGQNHSGSSCERRRSSAYVPIPCARIRRVRFARSDGCALGRQITSMEGSVLPCLTFPPEDG